MITVYTLHTEISNPNDGTMIIRLAGDDGSLIEFRATERSAKEITKVMYEYPEYIKQISIIKPVLEAMIGADRVEKLLKDLG